MRETHDDAVVAELGLGGTAVVSGYGHAVNLSDWTELSTDLSGRERVGLDVSHEDIAHVPLADSNRYAALLARFPAAGLFHALVGHLRRGSAHPTTSPMLSFFLRRKALAG